VELNTEETLVRLVDSQNAEPGASIFVWGGWALITVLTVIFVVLYGPNLPIWDDLDVVEVIAARRPLTITWLWSLHNEHRVPLPRLILLALYRLSGNDFRAGMFFNVAVLAIVAAAAIAVAAGRRGGSRTYDLLLPIILMNPSNATNLLWSWQVQLVLSSVLAGALILLIVVRDAWPGPLRAMAAGACLVSLTMCGANGVALVPALDCWLLAASWAHWTSAGPRAWRAAIVPLASAIPAIALTVLYFSGYHGSSQHPTSLSLESALRTSLQFVSLMFGTEARAFWPMAGLAALTLVASSILIVAHVVVRNTAGGRARAFGLLCAFGAFTSLALGIGWGRAGSGEQSGLESRYVTLIAPMWLAVIFTWDRFTSPVIQRVALTSLLSTVLALLWPITREAIESGQSRARMADAVMLDIRAGTPVYRLVKHHTPFLHPSQDVLAEYLKLLRTAHIGAFGAIKADPVFRAEVLSKIPNDVRQVRWENGAGRVTGVDPFLHYVLPRAATVAGIRLKYSHASTAGGPPHFRIWWTSIAGQQTAPGQSSANWALPTGRGQVTIIWVDDLVKEFWLQPDNQRCEFTVDEITLLYP
jgi:hypothetical protein